MNEIEKLDQKIVLEIRKELVTVFSATMSFYVFEKVVTDKQEREDFYDKVLSSFLEEQGLNSYPEYKAEALRIMKELTTTDK